MKSLFKLTGLLLVLMLAVSSCKKSVPKQTSHIPKDATFVISVNAKQLQDKLAKGNLSIDSLVKIFADASRVSDKLKKLDDLKTSGIDWSSDLYMFMQTKGSMMAGQSIVTGAIAAISDAGKFEAFIKSQSASVEIKKATDYSYVNIEGNLIGWNKDIVIALANKTSRGFGDNGNAAPATTDEQQLSSFFSMKDADAVSSISEFRDLMQQKTDAALWTNSSSALSGVPMLGMTKVSDLLNEAYSATTINFEDGKVVADSKYYLSKALADILKKHKSPDVDYSMLDHYPSNNITGYGLMSFDPQVVGDILRFSGLEGTINSYLSKESLTMDDILKAFKGDFSFIYSDFATVEKPSAWDSTVKTKQADGKFLLNVKVGDKASFEKVANVAVQAGILTKQGDTYTPTKMGGKFESASIDSKNILVASDDATLQQYKSGSGKIGLEGDAKDKPGGKSFSFYVDIAKILNAAPTDTADAAVTNLAKATFKTLSFNTDSFNGKTITSHGELHTVNEKENSLVSIVKFASFANAKEKERRAQYQEPTIDSATTIMDSTAVSPAH